VDDIRHTGTIILGASLAQVVMLPQIRRGHGGRRIDGSRRLFRVAATPRTLTLGLGQELGKGCFIVYCTR
jgi:hypothetical protein